MKHGHLDIVKYFVSQGANIHEGVRGLRGAIKRGHIEVIKYMIDQGVNIHLMCENALNLAIENGRFEVVKYLYHEESTYELMTIKHWSQRNAMDIIISQIT